MRIAPFFLAALLISCAGMPQIIPADGDVESEIETSCGRVYLSSPWRLVHSIEAVMPGGSKAYAIGIAAADPEREKIHAVIMSIEGLVVFEAETDTELRIIRALPPFDSRVFAAGLMNDIKLILFSPHGEKTCGMLADGSYICRYKRLDGNIVDVIFSKDRVWKIMLYDSTDKLIRTVTASAAGKELPSKIDLKAEGFPEYSMHMELIEAEKLAGVFSKSGKKSD